MAHNWNRFYIVLPLLTVIDPVAFSQKLTKNRFCGFCDRSVCESVREDHFVMTADVESFLYVVWLALLLTTGATRLCRAPSKM
jgi:hypothetical protein